MTSCVGEVVRVTIFYKIKRAISKKSTLSIVYSYGHATHRKKSRPSSTLTHPPLARLHVETPRREVNISEVLKRDPAYHAAGCVRLLSGDKVKGGLRVAGASHLHAREAPRSKAVVWWSAPVHDVWVLVGFDPRVHIKINRAALSLHRSIYTMRVVERGGGGRRFLR